MIAFRRFYSFAIFPVPLRAVKVNRKSGRSSTIEFGDNVNSMPRTFEFKRVRMIKGTNMPDMKGLTLLGNHSKFSIIWNIPNMLVSTWQFNEPRNAQPSTSIFFYQNVPFIISIQYSSYSPFAFNCSIFSKNYYGEISICRWCAHPWWCWWPPWLPWLWWWRAG